MSDSLEDHMDTVSVGRRTITKLRFADDIDALHVENYELESLASHFDRTVTKFEKEIRDEKPKSCQMTMVPSWQTPQFMARNLREVQQFKYLGAIISVQSF